jgi:hypothetical protein
MAYNVNLGEDIDPVAMGELVGMYNTAPHATLTHYGPGFDISPWLLQTEPDLEYYISRKITQDNMKVKRQEGFQLAVGTRCLVFNDISPMDKRRSSTRPEYFTVIGFERGKYQLKGENSGVQIWLPRFKIKPVEK